MMITDILKVGGRNKARRRKGRGLGSGLGKTSGRGSKGMGQHSCDQARRLTEGGQMPLFRRLPKRGFSNAKFRVEYQVVNVARLGEVFVDGAKVNATTLREAGLIQNVSSPVKILGTGELTRKLDVEATRFSKSAEEKITKAGGQVRKLEA